MKKCRVLVLIGSRSDEGLSAPLLHRLETDDFFKCEVQTLYGGNFFKTYKLMKELDDYFDLKKDTDLVISVGDRIEMFAATVKCFIQNVPIAHLYAGIVAVGEPTKDEVWRHCISLMSDLQFCESGISENNLFKLFNAVKKPMNAHIVGITHLDDMEIDESLVPFGSYLLVLYNPLKPSEYMQMTSDIKSIIEIIGNHYTFIIGSNPDIWYDSTKDLYNNLIQQSNIKFYKNLPRSQFLGLLKNCQKFISNSSSVVYEAPYFLSVDDIIPIGIRQKERTPVDISKTGASDKIIKIIKEWWIKKNEV